MNKIWGKIRLYLIIGILIVTIAPVSIKAKVSGGKFCRNNVGIKFADFEYNRSSGRTATGYYNSVTDNELVVNLNKDYTYTMYTYTAEVGTLESQDDLRFKSLKGTDVDYTSETLKGVSEKKVPVKAGQEVLVVVVLSGDKDGNTESLTSESDCETKKGVNVENGKKTVTCCTGTFNKKESAGTGDAVDIEGVAASKFVQNPNDENLYVDNLRAFDGEYGSVCKSALKGIYIDDNGNEDKDSNYTISKWAGDDADNYLAEYQQNYYNTVLSYCSATPVPFLLKESKIKSISNNLLKVFKATKQLEKNSTNKIEDINTTIENYKSKVGSDNYYIYNKATKKGEGNPNVLGSSLQCNYTDLVYNKDTKNVSYQNGKGEKSYLYAETNKVTRELTDPNSEKKKDVTICSTKCYEYLTVVYSPPQVVKAGLCFQYKVTIKSETDCAVDIGDFNKYLTPKDMCSPNPICENDETKTQAGPNEEFDSCVNSCDNGEYSQSCINKCYKKVYSNKNTKEISNNEKSTIENTDQILSNSASSMDNLILNSDNTSNLMMNVANFSDEKLEKYYSEPIPNCTTTYMKNHGVSDDCAEFYFEAKTLYPYGTYKPVEGKNKTFYWHITPPEDIKEEDNFKTVINKNSITDIEKIGRQIARSSPFYVRSVPATKDLIEGLLGKNAFGKNYRYHISSQGIKTLESVGGSYQCKMNCTYKGCNSKTDALTSAEYSNDIIDNLKNIDDGLSECNASAACDTTAGKGSEAVTEFEIKVTSKQQRNNEEIPTNVTGSNHLGSTTGDTNNKACPRPQKTPSMFVPAVTNDSTETGIFGLCYDGTTKRPHYQTTITFPGSWINLKTGEVNYDCQSVSTYRSKEQYYCTPYDDNIVNDSWWKWAINSKYQGTAPQPSNWNITSNLGTTEKGFGKYRWHIGFSCFYASDNKDIGEPSLCYRGNEGTPEDCNTSDEGKKEMSTKLNYDIRVADTTNLFPNNRLRGYNWGSAAQLKSNDSTISKALQNTGYGVDPIDYSKAVIAQGEKVYDQKADLVINLDANTDIISKIKDLDLDLDGTYTEVNDIPGLYYYNMSNDLESLLSSTDWSSWKNIRGINSKTAVENVKK